MVTKKRAQGRRTQEGSSQGPQVNSRQGVGQGFDGRQRKQIKGGKAQAIISLICETGVR